ncbi:hypothetical protein SAMN06264365_1335 [Actinoplanes regularis]|uniref:Uncharacterized protein n=2 Tax=Actinoplanes regularis TaxID=52697 RepID=A0A239J5K9_9ACTN|nr:hypothetical protein SAMN06264365_1335 [Actinoplanes regularis]
MREFAMTGLAVAAGLVIGAGPAAASSGSPAAPRATTQAPAAAQANGKATTADFSERIVGFYRSARACRKIGKGGEFRHRWDDFDCYPIRHGLRRGNWVLKAYYDLDGGEDYSGNSYGGPQAGPYGGAPQAGPYGGAPQNDPYGGAPQNDPYGPQSSPYANPYGGGSGNLGQGPWAIN